jgi:hypothetical protein
MQNVIERDLLGFLEKRAADDKILAIRGARQTGKSTLLNLLAESLKRNKVNAENITYLTFEDPQVLDDFVKDPRALLGSYIKGAAPRHYFLLDEVQYDKGAGKRLKLIVDTMKDIKVIITGSSSLEISQISKFLVGRVYLYDLYGLSFGEYLRYADERLSKIYMKGNRSLRLLLEGKRKNLEIESVSLSVIGRELNNYIIYGSYPEVAKHKSPDEKIEVIKNIYTTYIGKDVTSLLGITDSASFRKVLGMLSVGIGSLVNYNELATETQTYYKQLIGYICALEETYITRMMRPFHKSLRTELRKNPKIYLLDTGLRNYLINNFNDLDKRDDSGHLVENFVFNELYRNLQPNQQLNFWRTLAKAEVDFVFTTGSAIVPIEVKFSSFRKPEVGRGMRSFIDTYRPKTAIIATKDFIGTMSIEKTRVFFVPVAFL